MLFPGKTRSSDPVRDSDEIRVEIFSPLVDRIAQTVMNSSIEEGGKFLGRISRSAGRILLSIETYLDSGPRANNSAGHLLPDGDHQEHLFRIIEGYDPEIEHVGSWHTHHCNGLTELSDGDIAGYYRTVNSPDYHLDFFFVLLVTGTRGRQLEIRCFLFRRGEKNIREFDPQEIKIVDRAYRYDGILQEADRATYGFRSVSAASAQSPSKREGTSHPDPVEQLLMTVRSEDKNWFARMYPDAKVVRDKRNNSLSWKWTIHAGPNAYQVIYSYPQLTSSQKLGKATLSLNEMGGNTISSAEFALDRDRFLKIQDYLAEFKTASRFRDGSTGEDL